MEAVPSAVEFEPSKRRGREFVAKMLDCGDVGISAHEVAGKILETGVMAEKQKYADPVGRASRLGE